MPRPPKKPAEEWAAHKELIRTYYVVEKKNLQETMELMRTQHGFDATKKEYINRLQSWQMSKYLKKENWQLIHGRHSAQKQTKVLLNDEHINQKRLRRGLSRYRSEFNHSSLLFAPNSLSSRGITIRTPSPEPRLQLDLNIPWFYFHDNFCCHLLSVIHQLLPQLDWTNPSSHPFQWPSLAELSLQNARRILGNVLHLTQGNYNLDLASQILHCLEEIMPRKSSAELCLSSKEPFFLLIQCCLFLSSNGQMNLERMDYFLNWILESGAMILFNQFIDKALRSSSITIEIFLSHLLRSAVSLGNYNVVSTLLRKGTDPNCGNHRGQKEVVLGDNGRYYDDGRERWEVFFSDNLNPLHLAIIERNHRICKILLDYKADPNGICPYMPLSPLDLAISIGRGDVVIVEMLIAAGADISKSCEFELTMELSRTQEVDILKHTQRSSLMKAVMAQHLDIARLLLSSGARVNEVSYISGGALQAAVMNNDFDLVDLLLEAGAEVNIVENLEKSSIKYFTYILERHQHELQHAFPHCDPLLPHHSGRLALFDKRACERFDLEVNWWAFSLPIQIAARQNHSEMVRRLVCANAAADRQLNWVKIWEQIPVSFANMRLYQHMLKVSRERFQTALHESVEIGNVDLAVLLLQHGASVHCPNALGNTPLRLACGLQQEDLESEEDTKDRYDMEDDYEAAEDINEPQCQISETRYQLVQLLLDWGSDVNSPPGQNEGRTALQAASEVGDLRVMQLLLDKGANVDAPPGERDGLTALEAAARTGRPDLVGLLLEYGAVSSTKIDWMMLHGALKNDNVALVMQMLTQGANINALHSARVSSEIKGPVLQAAIKGGYVPIVAMLLDSSVSADSVVGGETALCTAVRGNQREILDLLLSHRANPSLPAVRVTPLAIAASMGQIDMVARLLDSGAEVDQLSYDPDISQKLWQLGTATPLFWAVFACQDIPQRSWLLLNQRIQRLDSISSLLLSHGADPDTGLKGGATILTSACKLGDYPLVEKLVKYGADPDLPDGRFDQPIVLAAKRMNKEIVGLLLDVGADAIAPYNRHPWFGMAEGPKEKREEIAMMIINDIRNRDEGTALVVAIHNEFFDLAIDMVGKSVDASPRIVWPQSALTAACMWGHMGLVQLLLGQGVDVGNQASSSWGEGLDETPLQAAARYGYFNIVKLLLEKGANVSTELSQSGSSALHSAASSGHLDIACLLLRNAKGVDTLDLTCKEAAKIAEREGYFVLARILQDYKPWVVKDYLA